MAGNLKIRTLGNWSLGITAVLAILCIAMSILGFRKYEVLQIGRASCRERVLRLV